MAPLDQLDPKEMSVPLDPKEMVDYEAAKDPEHRALEGLQASRVILDLNKRESKG